MLSLRDDWRSVFAGDHAGETALGVDFLRASERTRVVETGAGGGSFCVEQIVDDSAGLGAVVWDAVCLARRCLVCVVVVVGGCGRAGCERRRRRLTAARRGRRLRVLSPRFRAAYLGAPCWIWGLVQVCACVCGMGGVGVGGIAGVSATGVHIRHALCPAGVAGIAAWLAGASRVALTDGVAALGPLMERNAARARAGVEALPARDRPVGALEVWQFEWCGAREPVQR